jgi:hypothetical protein
MIRKTVDCQIIKKRFFRTPFGVVSLVPFMQSHSLNWTLFRELSSELKKLNTCCRNNCIANLPSGTIVTILNPHGMAQAQDMALEFLTALHMKVAVVRDVTSYILKMEEACSFDTCVRVYQTVRHRAPRRQ